MSVSMTYGSYNIEPVPQLTLSMQHVRNEAGELIDVLHTASLQGVLLSSDKPNPGAATLLDLQNDMRVALTSCTGCQQFTFSCDGTTLISAYARVNSLTFSPSSNNWVFTANYDLELQWSAVSDLLFMSGLDASGIDRTCLSCLNTTEETWDISIPDNPARYFLASCSGSGIDRNRDVIEISHNVSARGYNCCDSSGTFTYGWEAAKDWVVDRLGYTSGILADVSGVFSFTPTDFTTYNHSRTANLNKGAGSFNVQERWTLLGSTGIPVCLEDFSVSVETDNTNRFTNVSIQGTINGLETRNSSFVITKTKIQSAEECWAVISPLIYSRVNCLAASGCPLRSTPTRTSVLKSPTQGLISYNYTYDNRPQLVSGSLSEQISISDTLASEQVAQIQVMGRRAGPILYPLNSNNVLEKRANISILLAAPTGCYSGSTGRAILCNLYNEPNTSGINSLLCCLESGMTLAGYTYYRTSDTQNFDIISGQLSRDVAWLYQKCSGISAPASFC